MTSIVSSSVWDRDIKSRPPIPGNVDALTVHWVGSSSYNRKRDRIADGIKAIEKSQMRNNSALSCVSYNFFVDKFGRVWEGRGFRYRNAANGGNANNLTSMSVCVLVGQSDSQVTPDILSGLRTLYSEAVKHYGRPLKVECHSDVRPTQCPGPLLTSLVRSGRIQTPDSVAVTPVTPIVKPPAPLPVAGPAIPKFPGQSIRLGSSGDDVRAIQARLAQRGFYSLRVDGKFGPMTDISVKNFQRRHARPIDGIVGIVTWSALFS